METFVAVRFSHEIALKGLNRPFFLRRLSSNLERALQGTGVRPAPAGQMVALLPMDSEQGWPAVKERLENLVGIEGFGLAYRVLASIDAINGALAHLLQGRSVKSFRISAQRSDKTFPLTSPEINRQVGAFVQRLTGWPVDLEEPELDIGVRILPGHALLSFEETKGLGGLPVGVSGRVAALMSGGIDSPVASFTLLRRGCQVVFVHFHAFPLVEGTSREKAQELVRLLTKYQFHSVLYLVPFAEVQKRIILTTPPEFRVVLYRRFMFRMAQAIAQEQGCLALVTGESLGQVSSQTLENLTTIQAVCRLPVLRPLIGMDKEEITAVARRLGTYPISILPDQDCCSLFVPKHPATRTRPEEAERLEEGMEVEGMVKQAVEAAEKKEFFWPE